MSNEPYNRMADLQRTDFVKILEKYPIGTHKSHKRITTALDNSVYILRTTKGKYVLKVHEESTSKSIKFQMKVLEVLEKKNIKLAKIIKTSKDQQILKYNKLHITIQKFIEGINPKRISLKLFGNIGNEQGKIHKILTRLNIKNPPIWKKNYQFQAFPKSNIKKSSFNLNKLDKTLISEMKSINRKQLTKSLIHGDLTPFNYLVHKEKINAIIDWDGLHEDYLIQELSTFIAHALIELKKFNKEKIKAYLKIYQKIIKLNPQEKKATYYFVKKRILYSIYWYNKQLKIHKDQTKFIKAVIEKSIIAYLEMEKISLNEFMSLF